MGKHKGKSSDAPKGKKSRFGSSGKAIYEVAPKPPVASPWHKLSPKTMTVADYYRIPKGALEDFAALSKDTPASLLLKAKRNQERLDAGGELGPAQGVFSRDDILDLISRVKQNAQNAGIVNDNDTITKFDGNSNEDTQQDGDTQKEGGEQEDASVTEPNVNSNVEEREGDQKAATVAEQDAGSGAEGEGNEHEAVDATEPNADSNGHEEGKIDIMYGCMNDRQITERNLDSLTSGLNKTTEQLDVIAEQFSNLKSDCTSMKKELEELRNRFASQEQVDKLEIDANQGNQGVASDKACGSGSKATKAKSNPVPQTPSSSASSSKAATAKPGTIPKSGLSPAKPKAMTQMFGGTDKKRPHPPGSNEANGSKKQKKTKPVSSLKQ